MRPRRFGRGEQRTVKRIVILLLSFNAATAFRPWRTALAAVPPPPWLTLQCGHGVSAVENGSRPGPPSRPRAAFNAATAFRPWRTAIVAVDVAADDDPSMRPRRFGRGERRQPAGCVDDCLAFNAATAFRPWRTKMARVRERVQEAPSMRPRRFGRGEL